MEKIIEAARKSQGGESFLSCVEYAKKLSCRMKLSTGSSQLDQILGGGVETGSITEIYGEFRCGKTQIAHTMSVLAQLDPEQGGGAGRVLYIDTEGTFRPDRVKQIAEARGYLAEGVQDNILVSRTFLMS